MNNESTKTYWKVPPSAQPPVDAAPSAHETWSVSRRRFLEAAGFTLSLATAGGCGRAPEIAALPFPIHPEGVVPGQMQYYGSTCAGCSAGCGLLVGARDGRPLKMEGMPEHPISSGGLCAVGQAQPLGLYDSQRLTGPVKRANPTEESTPIAWSEVDLDITTKLREIKASGGAVCFVTPTITSPTLKATIDQFLSKFDDGRHVVFDAASSSAILDAHEKTHGTRLLPHYQLDKASVLVSFGADFLGTWISPVEFTAAWSSRRTPTAKHPEMSYHVQLESRMSLTGSKADRRFIIAPDQQHAVLVQLAHQLASLAGKPLDGTVPATSSVPGTEIANLARRMWEARGESLVLCDSQDVATQVVVNTVNHLLGGYGKTLDIRRPSNQRQGNDRDVQQLVEDLHSGKVAALLVAGTDLTHNLPGRESLAQTIEQVPLVISFAERVDDFSSLAGYICPDHHGLESWSDAEPIHGLISIVQPTLRPIGKTRAVVESLANWMGQSGSQYDLVRNHWHEHLFPLQATQGDFTRFWDRAVHDGFVELTREPIATQPLQPATIESTAVESTTAGGSKDDLAVVLYHKIGMPDSRHAHNPWLHELPDPLSKVTWDNYVCISPALARQKSLVDGDIVRVKSNDTELELPVFVQPGQHAYTLAIALAYGCPGTDRFAKVGPQWLESRLTVESGQTVGKNAASLLAIRDSHLRYTRGGISLEKTGRRQELASTQEHDSIEVPANVAPLGGERRNMIQETSLAEFANDPQSGKPEMHHHGDVQLWAEDHPKTGHWWGMVIDLNACTGCSACVIACQSENNVPVVGRDEVRRQREMHWMRLDRYYSSHYGDNPGGEGEEDEVEVYHQPMMCQHCDNAPCETVCPVLATVHSEEGLNEQAYNRCVGTRYCANNCPYKVRRFNWFRYAHDDTLQNLALNPDVTVRTRGVMEKCSMCVQRIEAGKVASRRQGEPLVDGQIQTACQQSCPAQAIVFGDVNDPESRVSAALKDPRRYGVLEEFNFRPSVAYLRVVKNVDKKDVAMNSAQEGTHG